MTSGSAEDEDGQPPVPRLLRRVVGASTHLAAILLQAAAVAIVVNAVYRYAAGGGFHFISEVSRFCLLLVVFLGIAGTHLAGGHVQVEVLISSLPRWGRALLNHWLIPIVSIFFLSLVAYSGGAATLEMFERGTTTPSRPAILLWPIMAAVPFGCGLLILLLVVRLIQRIAGRGA